ncbi:hypothetical protein M6B38_319265 [Iris pallida]|uniref:Uncharacterized protein n=1 Tax=Iris pallida TaxID=29817 RepID=A0AAX6H253_IRIPA|nr:hypothetical protein M6B38_332665 [Iris pallida]KAJ6838828.1 hypothetical protein M6B38_319265 [Iris pallida]
MLSRIINSHSSAFSILLFSSPTLLLHTSFFVILSLSIIFPTTEHYSPLILIPQPNKLIPISFF